MTLQGHVLIVDDDPYIREVLAYNVRRVGFEPLQAENGRVALDLLTSPTQPTVDLVLADVWMPEMSGLELLRAIMDFRPELPVALISGQATVDSTIEALNIGAYAYLVKPVQMEQIRDVISRGMRKVQESHDRHMMERKLKQVTDLEGMVQSLQEQLPRANSGGALPALIDGLHHELGNVTMAITLNLSAMEQAGKLPVAIRENIEDLHASADELVQLVNRLRNVPKVDDAQADQIHDLRNILHDAVTSLHPQVEAKQASISLDLPNLELLVACDPASIQRAFKQVLDNAVEAINVRGTVLIQASVKDGEITISVNDDGPGVPAELLGRLFEPNATTKIEDGFVRGLGLGLFIARAVVELHHGRILARNRATGGATIEMAFPLYQG